MMWNTRLLPCALWLAACGGEPEPTRHLIASLSATPGLLLADGAASAKLALALTWADDGSPAEGLAIELRSDRGSVDTLTPGSGQTDAQGLWQSSVSSSTAGDATLTAFNGDMALCHDDLDQCHPAQVKLTFTDKPLVYTREQTGAGAVMFTRLGSDGSLSAAPTAIATGLYSLPALAHGTKGFGVAFTGKAAAADSSTTWFVGVDDSGAAGTPVQVATDTKGDASSTYPQIASDGKQYTVVWQDRRNGSWDLFFRLLNSDGSFASSELTVRTELDSISVAPQVVWSGKEYGVVFADTRKEYGHFQIYLARVAADGSKVTAEHAITSAADNADTPGVAFHDGGYWINWIEKPWYGDARPFAVRAQSAVIDNGADLGMAFSGAGADIGAIEFGLPWGSSTSISTSLHLALFDPV